MRIRAILSYIAFTSALLSMFVSISAWSAGSKDRAFKVLQGIPIPFIKNEGQVDKRVRFYAKTFGGTLFITKDGQLVYKLPRVRDGKIHGGIVLKEVLENAKVERVKGLERANTKVSYFIGKDKKKWVTNLETFKSISLGEIYEGISLELKAYSNNVEKIFKVEPGADPERIILRVEGGEGLRIDPITGELVVRTELGEVKFTKPVAYQEIDGRRVNVSVRYKLLSRNTYSFEVGGYDRTKTLVIDPLLASTYLGGGNGDFISAMIMDPNGDIYVTGYTESQNFPGAGSYNGGVNDVFVAKLNGDLTNLLSATYIGGSFSERADAIAIDQAGNIYIAGRTTSNNFPTTSGAYIQNSIGSGDAFITKLSGDLSNIIASTYVGTVHADWIKAIAIDSAGNIYVAGGTQSNSFPPQGYSPYQACNGSGGDEEAFIAKFDNALSSLLAATCLRGSQTEEISSMVVDSNGNIYVAGTTLSNDFPTTNNAYQSTHGGGQKDAFISKLDSGLQSLLASTYLGGNGDDAGLVIKLDQNGNVYIVGYTTSTDFPTAGNPYQNLHKNPGGEDAFVAKLDGGLSNLIASTYLGGSSDDRIYSIALSQNGDIYVAGYTESTDFPVTPNVYQTDYAGGLRDAFVTRLSADMSGLVASTYIGGGTSDSAISILLDSSGNVYIAGNTDSTNFPITQGAFQTTNAGNNDVFISKLTADLSGSTAQNTAQDNQSSGGGCSAVSLNTILAVVLVPVVIALRRIGKFKKS